MVAGAQVWLTTLCRNFRAHFSVPLFWAQGLTSLSHELALHSVIDYIIGTERLSSRND